MQRDWRDSIIIGSLVGGAMIICFVSTRGFNFTQSPTTNTNDENVNITSTPQSTSSTAPSFSQEEAADLINNWQNAKRQMFAPPFDRQLLEQFLTGKGYENNVGSQTWLQDNNAHYTYGVQSVDSIEEFIVSGDRATLDAVITEERTFYVNDKVIHDSNTAFDTRLVRYNLKLDNGQWKIEDYNTVKKIKTR
ncbi:MAG: hypothetical protein RL662_1052 [Bacteroidota bacterium]|jgi:serine/threonine-protein kinase